MTIWATIVNFKQKNEKLGSALTSSKENTNLTENQSQCQTDDIIIDNDDVDLRICHGFKLNIKV